MKLTLQPQCAYILLMVEEILASTEKKMPEQRMLEPEKLDTAWNALLFLS